jgi:hypothetical protein
MRLLARPACLTLRRLDLSDRDDVAARSGEAERLVVALPVRLEELELCRLNTNLRLVLEKCPSLVRLVVRMAQGLRFQGASEAFRHGLRELELCAATSLAEREARALLGAVGGSLERIAIAHVPQWRCACWAFSCLRCPKATHVTLNQCGRPGPHGLQCSEDGVHESAFLEFLKRCAGSIEWIDLSGSAFRRKFPFPIPYTYPRRNDTASRLFARGADVPSLPRLSTFLADSVRLLPGFFFWSRAPRLRRLWLGGSVGGVSPLLLNGSECPKFGCSNGELPLYFPELGKVDCGGLRKACPRLEELSLRGNVEIDTSMVESLSWIPSLNVEGCRGVSRAVRRAAYERRVAHERRVAKRAGATGSESAPVLTSVTPLSAALRQVDEGGEAPGTAAGTSLLQSLYLQSERQRMGLGAKRRKRRRDR